MEGKPCGVSLCMQPAVTALLLDLAVLPLCKAHLPALHQYSDLPQDPDSCLDFAETYIEKAQFYDAVEALSLAFSLSNAANSTLKSTQIAYRLGHFHLTFLESPDIALSHFDYVILHTASASRLYIDTVYLHSVALMYLYRYQEAVSMLSQIREKLEEKRDFVRVNNLLGWVCYLQGDREQAELRLLQSLDALQTETQLSEAQAETWLFLASVTKTVVYAEKAVKFYNGSEEKCENWLRCMEMVLLVDSFTVTRWTGVSLKPGKDAYAEQVTHLFNAVHKKGEMTSVSRIKAYRGRNTPALARELHLYVCIHEYDQSAFTLRVLQQALDICVQTHSLVAWKYMEMVTLVYDVWDQAETYQRQLADTLGRVTALVRFYLMKDRLQDALFLLHSRLAQQPDSLLEIARFCYGEAPLKPLAKQLYTQIIENYQQYPDITVNLAEVHSHLGTLYLDNDEFDLVFPLLTTALHLHVTASNDPIALASCYKRLATCFLGLNRLEEGKAAYQTCISLYKSVHIGAKFTLNAVSAYAESQNKEEIWTEYIQQLREYGDLVVLVRGLEHFVKGKNDKMEMLVEIKEIYSEKERCYGGLLTTLVTLMRIYEEDEGSENKKDLICREILRLVRGKEYGTYISLLKKFERSNAAGWKFSFLREELSLAQTCESDVQSRALVELAEALNEDFLRTQNQSSLQEAELLVETALPLLRSSQTLAAARLLQRVSRMINEHVVNEEMEREALGKVALAEGSLSYTELGSCYLKCNQLSAVETCLLAEVREEELTLSRVSRGLALVYAL